MELPERQVARVSEDAWFLKLYLWMWKQEPHEVNFCKMFWGFVFAPLNLLARVILFPAWLAYRGLKLLWPSFSKGVDWLLDRMPQRKSTFTPIALSKSFTDPERPVTKPKRERRILNWLSSRAARTADGAVRGITAIWPVLKIGFLVIAAAFGIGLAYEVGYWLTKLVPLVPPAAAGVWIGLKWAAHGFWWAIAPVLLALAVMALIAAGIIRAAMTPRGERVGKKIGTGTLSFFQLMKGGVKSVKYRTCPIIEVEKKNG